MTKTHKVFSYISITLLLLIVGAVAGQSAFINEDKKGNALSAKDDIVNVFLDDKLIVFEDKPAIKSNKVYVPVEEFSQKIGADIKFSKSNKIIIKKDDKNLVIDTKEFTVITETNKVFYTTTIDKGKNVLLPIDDIVSHFGYSVSELVGNTIKVNSKSAEKLDIIEPEEVKEVVSEEEKQKVVYLTFDDGPNVNTPGILEVLKSKNAEATFFMLGSSVLAHQDIVKRVYDEGHALGVHSMTHNFKTVYASPQSFVNEMNRVNELLFEIVGERTQLLRPPYGSMPYLKDEFRDLVTSWGYRIWDWDIDSKDSVRQDVTAQEIYMQVTTQMANRTEAVILFHDKASTLQALPNILDYLIENGFEIKKLDSDMIPMNFWNDTRKFS